MAQVGRRARVIAGQERAVDLLDVDAAVDRLDAVGDLTDPAPGVFCICSEG